MIVVRSADQKIVAQAASEHIVPLLAAEGGRAGECSGINRVVTDAAGENRLPDVDQAECGTAGYGQRRNGQRDVRVVGGDDHVAAAGTVQSAGPGPAADREAVGAGVSEQVDGF